MLITHLSSPHTYFSCYYYSNSISFFVKRMELINQSKKKLGPLAKNGTTSDCITSWYLLMALCDCWSQNLLYIFYNVKFLVVSTKISTVTMKIWLLHYCAKKYLSLQTYAKSPIFLTCWNLNGEFLYGSWSPAP